MQDSLYALSLSAYDADWNAIDQIPFRAIERGLVSRPGSIDETQGGSTTRCNANLQLAGETGAARYQANADAADSAFERFSNLTCFLETPLNGDQITQHDRRWLAGADVDYAFDHPLLGGESQTRAGLQLRHDRILELARSRGRVRGFVAPVRDDSVAQTSLGLFATDETRLASWPGLRLGLRFDQFRLDAGSRLAANTGEQAEPACSPCAEALDGPAAQIGAGAEHRPRASTKARPRAHWKCVGYAPCSQGER